MGRVVRWAYWSGLISSAGMTALMCALNVLVHGRVDPLAALSYGLLTLLLTLGDRLKRHAEDRGQLRETCPAGHVQAHRRPFVVLVLLIAAAQLALFALEPWLMISSAICVAACLFYFVRLPLVGRRIKALPGGKAIGMPLIMVVGFLAYHPALPPANARSALAIAAVLLICHIDAMLYDLKDEAQDRAAGIVSLAAALPRRAFLALEAALCLVGLALAAALDAPLGAALAGVFGVLLLAIWRLRRHAFDLALCAGIDGAVGIVFAAGLIWLVV